MIFKTEAKIIFFSQHTLRCIGGLPSEVYLPLFIRSVCVVVRVAVGFHIGLHIAFELDVAIMFSRLFQIILLVDQLDV